MSETILPSVSDLPAPPENSSFFLVEIKEITLPHPFVIGGQHIAIASDHFLGMLTKEAVEFAEVRGVRCQHTGCLLKYAEHETMIAGIIAIVNRPENLSEVEGLHDYLLAIKDKAQELNIYGFAFIDKLH